MKQVIDTLSSRIWKLELSVLTLAFLWGRTSAAVGQHRSKSQSQLLRDTRRGCPEAVRASPSIHPSDVSGDRFQQGLFSRKQRGASVKWTAQPDSSPPADIVSSFEFCEAKHWIHLIISCRHECYQMIICNYTFLLTGFGLPPLSKQSLLGNETASTYGPAPSW